MKRVLEQEAAIADLSFSAELVAWQKQHGRHQLPWQNTRDPYRIWLSEIMLQQTQVSAVIPYYERFLNSFSNVKELAEAPADEVMAHWSGLGYYSRARNLHSCAQKVMNLYDGVFPSDPSLLVQLPGIGRSTAAAIAAFAYGARAAILDGNVKRVFCRVFGVEGFPGEKKVENLLWQRAEANLPVKNIEAYTQGLMDLGATLCTRSRPGCQQCPFQRRCVAALTGRTAELPARKPKKAVPEKSTVMLVVLHDGHVLLEARPNHGIWGGLLSLPELSRMPLSVSERVSQHGIESALAEFGEVSTFDELPDFSHGFTHYKLHVKPVRVELLRRFQLVGQPGYQWIPLRGIVSAALPAPVKKLLLAIDAD